MGKPVALLASAELRERRGLTSMTTMSSLSGSPANWMFTPPPFTPMRRMMRLQYSTYLAYSSVVRVCAGATTALSPVCTPMASMFSFQPSTLCSTSTSVTGLALSPTSSSAGASVML